MADKEAMSKALGSEKPKLHAQGVHYERSDNGGFLAHVHMHTKAAPHVHHHTQHHIVSSKDALAAHMEEHMGDQPDVQQGAEPEPDGDEAAAAGGAAAGAGQGGPSPQGMM